LAANDLFGQGSSHDPRSGVVGIETEYGVVAEGISPEHAVREMFRPVLAWGRSTSVFTPGGARLYLDIGSHPEYATAECLTLEELLAQDRAGDQIMAALAARAAKRLGLRISLIKNNTDSAGHAFGCHENYQVPRVNSGALSAKLIPFLVTRQLIAGAGKVLTGQFGGRYVLSQRADHICEVVSSASTRARPMINARDEPHADGKRYRRLHVIVGDSNMSGAATRFKVGSMRLVLRGIADGGKVPALELANPVTALREVAHGWRDRQGLTLADGRTIKPVDIQEAYLALAERCVETSEEREVTELWGRALTAWRSGDFDGLETELDWLAKLRLLERYQARTGLPLGHPKVLRLELAYHQLDQHALRPKLEAAGQMAQIVQPAAVRQAMRYAPQSTRAGLRGRFITAARNAGREYSVDWVRLRLGRAGSVALLDPLDRWNEAAELLIESIEPGKAGEADLDRIMLGEEELWV
jgi:proteasome accessory factor A